MIYTIQFSNGDAPITVDGYVNVLPTLWQIYGAGVVFGHAGDISEGGDRTLFWQSEEDADDDAGELALGKVVAAARS